MFKKGSLLYRNVYIPMSSLKCTQSSLNHESTNADTFKKPASHLSENRADTSEEQRRKQPKKAATSNIIVEHTDVIKNKFWEGKTWLLSGE